jgi:hypothetical protein
MRLVHLIGTLITINFALMYPRGVCAQNPKDPPMGRWKLKRSCNELRLESTALVSIRRTPRFSLSSECGFKSEVNVAEIAFEQSNPESIPLGSITAIVREVVIRRPVQREIQQTISALDPEELLRTANDAGEGIILLPLYPVVIVAAAGAMEPFRGVKTHLNSVRLLWIEDGNPRSSNFFLSPGSAESLLSHLAQATGKRWTKVHFDSEALDKHASQVIVHFDRTISAMNITVGAGSYTLQIFRGTDSTRLVYLLSGDQKDVLTAFTAEASPRNAEMSWKIRLTRDADGSWCPSELNTDLEHLQLRACQN